MAAEELESTLNYRDETHEDYLLKRISRMRKHSVLTDIILKVEGIEFPAHRNVLAASSDYFMAMFSGHMSTVGGTVTLQGISSTALEILLGFIYGGEILITEDNVEDILVGSCLFLLDSVTLTCCKFIQERLNLTNCWGIRTLSNMYNCTDLFHRAQIFVNENFVEAVKVEEFYLLPAGELAELLSDDEIVVPSEDAVFDVLVNWISHDKDVRYKSFPSLLKKVRLPQMSMKFLEDVVATHELVVQSAEATRLVADARKQMYSSNYEYDEEKEEENKWNVERRCLRTVNVIVNVGGSLCEFYNDRTDSWVQLAPLSIRHCPGMETLGKYIYVVGGSKEWKRMKQCERYDPDKDKWEVQQPMNVSRSNVGLIALDGLLYAVGGYDGRSPTKVVESYNPRNNEWKYVASMHNCRDGACVASDGRFIYAISGYDGANYLSSVEFYDPTSDSWTIGETAPIIERREDAMVAVIDSKIYLIGGYQGSVFLASCEVFDIEANKWDFVSPMNGPRYQAGCAVLNRKIYVCGGWSDGGQALDSVESYDVMTDTWSFVASLPTPSAARSTHLLFPRKQIETLMKKQRGKCNVEKTLPCAHLLPHGFDGKLAGSM